MILVNEKTGLFESFEKAPEFGYLTPSEWLQKIQKENSQELVEKQDKEEINRLITNLSARYTDINLQSVALIRSILCGTSNDNELNTLKTLETEAKDIVKQLEGLREKGV